MKAVAAGGGPLHDRLPLRETLFWESVLESAENCMLSV